MPSQFVARHGCVTCSIQEWQLLDLRNSSVLSSHHHYLHYRYLLRHVSARLAAFSPTWTRQTLRYHFHCFRLNVSHYLSNCLYSPIAIRPCRHDVPCWLGGWPEGLIGWHDHSCDFVHYQGMFTFNMRNIIIDIFMQPESLAIWKC